MAITKVINDAVDLNQTSDYSGLRLPVGTTGNLLESFTTDYLVVGGGGSGGKQIAAGGGAGGLRTSYGSNSGGGSAAESSLTLTEGTAYDVTVGAGGASVTAAQNARGNNGQSSIFSTITSLGGGGGGTSANGIEAGLSGGSGGGSARTGGSGGNGTTDQGYAGGAAAGTSAGTQGGGGGSSSLGVDGSTTSPGTTQGNGGTGLEVNIIGGTNNYYASGGGAGSRSDGSYNFRAGTASAGGGTDGTTGNTSSESGVFNTGGGSGGTGYNGVSSDPGNGGSGVVILRYPTASVSSFTTTGTLNTPSTTDTLANTAYPVTNAVYYKLDGDAADSSGNGKNGADSNVTWANGRFSQAAVFNGDNSRITLPAISAIPTNSSPNKSYSVSFWINSTTARLNGTSGTYRSGQIFGFYDDTYAMIGFGGNSSGSFPAGKFYYYNYGGSGLRNNWIITPNSYADGNYHHVVVTDEYVSSGNTRNRKLYVDGSLIVSDNQANTWAASSSGNTIGSASAQNQLNADLDQVRIFSTALLDSQVTELYEEHYQTKFTDGSDTAIVFTEGTGTVTFSGAGPAPPQGALRTNTSYSEDGSASVIEHYNGTDWKYFDAIKYCTTNTLNFPSGAGCVASYNLNNNVNDIGNTYSGANNNVTFNASGKFGAAGVFNGSNAFVDSGFTALSSTEASISFWVNIAAYTAYGGFVGDSTGTGRDSRFFLGQGNGTSGNLWVSIGNGSSAWSDETTVSLTSYGLNTWFHLVGTVNGTSVKIYINESLIHTFTSSISYAGTGTLPYYFGGWGNSLFLNGELDQIRFFTTALTLAQVKDLYNNEIACS